MSDGRLSGVIDTPSTRMEPLWRLSFQAPVEDVPRIMGALTQVVPLAMGFYDHCAFQSGDGLERYRPREHAAAGAEDKDRERPGVVEVSCQIPRERDVLKEAVEAIVAAHSYQEPVITVCDILASRSKGGDHGNPNRWWNRGGDWMTSP